MSKVITVQCKFVFESVEVVHVYGSWLTLKAKVRTSVGKIDTKLSQHIYSLNNIKKKAQWKREHSFNFVYFSILPL